MLSLCMKLLETDNEENAVICLRIIFDLHKNFRPTLEREVQPFLDFVQRIYQGRRSTRQSVGPPRAACHRSLPLPALPTPPLPPLPAPPHPPTTTTTTTTTTPLTIPSPHPPFLARPAHHREHGACGQGDPDD
jgi:hypothetical protein